MWTQLQQISIAKHSEPFFHAETLLDQMRDVDRRPSRPSRPVSRDGGNLIKSFVHEADQRRAACRFAKTVHNLAPQPPGRHHSPRRPRTGRRNDSKDDRVEIRSGSPTNNQEEDKSTVIEGLFTTTKRVPRGRLLSLTPAMLPAAAAAAASGLGANSKPIFTFTRRKLQMESASVQAAIASSGSSSPHRSNDTGHRPTTAAVISSQQFGHRPKASNLAAKLDAILRSSPWMRRKVVLQPQSQRGLSNTSTLRLLANQSAPQPPSQQMQEPAPVPPSSEKSSSRRPSNRVHQRKAYSTNDEDTKEMEKRVIATFQRFVRLWRQRKRRSERAALNLVNGNIATQQTHSGGNSNNLVAGRPGGKLRRELDAQSSNVASILSRRVIGEVPALKFFDEPETHAPDIIMVEPPTIIAVPTRATTSDTESDEEPSPDARYSTEPRPLSIGELMAASARNRGKLSPQRRVTPRGVCYTLDESGCRHIKMRSDNMRANVVVHASTSRRKKNEEVTIERATGISLRRKMARRVKVKRQAIGRFSEEFRESRKQLTAKLEAQLVLRQAEGDRMLNQRSSLLLSDNANLPPHMAEKELALARLRFKKANLQATCQTLAVLGSALHHVETAGEVSGREISSGELRFLELFRCAVEGDHALTPLLVDGIRSQFSAEHRQKPLVAGLLGLLDRFPRE